MAIQQEIEWNLNQGFGIMILKLIDEVNQASKVSDIDWFIALRTLFRNIEGIKRVDEKQMQVIDVKMILVGNIIDSPSSETIQGKAVQRSVLKNVKKDLDDINRKLMRAINEAELIKFHIDFRDPSKSILKGG